jgi:hypothetical protein
VNNAAAIGYMILAVRAVHLTAEMEEKLEAAMLRAMDERTEEEAEEVFKNT